jgi:hypothetical protein
MARASLKIVLSTIFLAILIGRFPKIPEFIDAQGGGGKGVG